MSAQQRAALPELARVFLRLGSTAFGGPAAHTALLHQELVVQRQWLSEEQFLDLVSAANLIPGPNSTELVIHIGLQRAGYAGMLVAGLCFIAPAMFSVLVLAAAYVRFGSLPAALALLAGVQPVVVAVVVHALLGLGRAALRRWQTLVIAGGVLLPALAGVNEVGLLLAGAAAGWWLFGGPQLHMPPAAALLLPAVAAASALPFGLPVLFLVFLKIGAVLYGSGYVLLLFLRADLVVRLGWITERQLLDAVAASQLTPGPLFTSATFIGYLLGGLPGALLATLGIFLSAFIFVPLTQPLLARMRSGFSGRGECCFAWAAGCGGRAAGVGRGGRSGGRAAGCGSAAAAFANADSRQPAVAGRCAAGCAARRIVVGCCAGAGSAQAASIWPRHHELTRGACPNSQTKSRG